MDLPDLLEPDRIKCHCKLQSKKRTLQTIAELLGASLRANTDHQDLPEDDRPPVLSDMEILDALINRERLGSTGLGHGVALPHSRLSSINEPIAAFVTLSKGVDYESADGESVDLVLGLLVPEHCNDEHLKILAKLARRFSDEELRNQLRQFESPEDLFAHLGRLANSHS